jgi:hypothetical protein
MKHVFIKKAIGFDQRLFSNEMQISATLNANQYEFDSDNSEFLNEQWKIYCRNEPPKIEINGGYLLFFDNNLQSGANFFHFHFHEMQKILGYLELLNINPDLKLYLRTGLSNFQKYLINLLVPQSNIIEIDIFSDIYSVSDVYVGCYISISEIPQELVDIYQNIGRSICEENDVKSNIPTSGICIRRRQNKGFAGDSRFMLNQDKYDELMTSHGYVDFYFEDYDLEGKLIGLLSNQPRQIIMEIGSGITNFLFFPKEFLQGTSIIVIDQDRWKLDKSRINDIFKKIGLDYVTSRALTKINNPSDPGNNPFSIDVKDVEEKMGFSSRIFIKNQKKSKNKNAILLFGISDLRQYEPQDRRRLRKINYNVDYTKSISNYESTIMSLFPDSDIFISTYNSINSDKLISQYDPLMANFTDSLIDGPLDYGVKWGRNFHLKKVMQLLEKSKNNGNQYENIIITRFDLIFDTSMSLDDFDFNKLNVISKLEKDNNICSNFYLLPFRHFETFYDLISEINYDPYLLLPKFKKVFNNIHFIRNESTNIENLSYYKICR